MVDNSKTLDDVMVCPICNGNNTYQFGTDKYEFSSDGTGHIIIDCACKDCKKDFRLICKFDYSITDSVTR